VPIEAIRSLLFQVGNALAYAHRRGVIHRDIKPANILLDADGNAVVTDFGIAKVAESTTHTQTGTMVGTPAYMSPEQCYAGQVSWPSDQYSLGIVAYELLTGRPPFSGPSFMVMKAHIEGAIPPIREVRPDCPPELELAVRRMLAKDPAERWPSMGHALAALGAKPLAEDDPVRELLIALAAPDPAFRSPPTPPAPMSPAPRSRATAADAYAAAADPGVIVIADPPAVIEVGERFTLTGAVRRRDGSTLPEARIAWSSRDHSVATIDAWSALVTAVAPGTTSIVASFGDARGELALTVSAAAATVVNISLPPEPLYVGESVQMTAVVQNKRGTPLPLAPTWSSSDARIATISRTGVLTAVAPGSVRISGQAGAVNGSVVLWVSPVTVEALRLVSPPESLVCGESVRLTATALDARDAPLADRTIVWSSSDRAVATVSPAGIVTAHGNGPVTITAACDGISASAALTVVEPPVASVTIAAPPRHIMVGNTFRLVATPLDAHGRSLKRSLDWKSSNEGIASVSPDGIVTPQSPGQVMISATSEGMEGSVRITVGRLTQPVSVRALASGRALGRRVTTVVTESALALRRKLAAAAAAVASAFARVTSVARGMGHRVARRNVVVGGVAVAVVALVGVVLAGTVGKGSESGTRAQRSDTLTVATSAGASAVPQGAVVDSVELSATPPSVFAGDTFSLIATARATTQEPIAGRVIRWSSSDSSVAAVGETTGVVTALLPGSAVISADIDGKRGSVAVDVQEPNEGTRAISAVSVTKPGTLRVGDASPLRATVTPAAGSSASAKDLTWTSSNPRVVAIDAARGVMRAVGPGVAIIAAGAGSVRSTATVVVLSSTVASVAVATPRPMTTGEVLTFSAQALDASGKELPGKTLAWASDNSAVATVDARSGVVTAQSTGTAVITARVDGVTGRTVLLVTSGAPTLSASELIRRQLAEFVAAVRTRNAGRVEELLTPAEGGEGQTRAKLLKLLREGKPRFAVGNQSGGAPQVTGSRATADFSVPLSWKTRLGTKRVVVPFRAELSRSDGGGWRITSCRIIGAPDLD
jgi:uncharacterized protein YjdB